MCTKERTKETGIAGSGGKYRANGNTTPLEIADLTRPVCHILSYVDDTIAFPIDLMHTFFVGGMVPTIFSKIFLVYPQLLSKSKFFDTLRSVEYSSERERIFKVCKLCRIF